MNLSVAIYTADPQLFLLLRHILGQAGISARLVTEATEIVSLCRQEKFELILLDATMDPANLPSLVRSCKSNSPQSAVAVLSSSGKPSAGVGDLVDLTIAKPFDPAALLGFLQTLRDDRGRPAASIQSVAMRYADVELNPKTVKVTRNGRVVPLTPLQFRLLRYLMERPTIVQDRETLIAAAWPMNAEVEPRTVDIHMGHLRRALASRGPNIIRTVRGSGYALDLFADRKT